jgi:hypothetical protein
VHVRRLRSLFANAPLADDNEFVPTDHALLRTNDGATQQPSDSAASFRLNFNVASSSSALATTSTAMATTTTTTTSTIATTTSMPQSSTSTSMSSWRLLDSLKPKSDEKKSSGNDTTTPSDRSEATQHSASSAATAEQRPSVKPKKSVVAVRLHPRRFARCRFFPFTRYCAVVVCICRTNCQQQQQQ